MRTDRSQLVLVKRSICLRGSDCVLVLFAISAMFEMGLIDKFHFTATIDSMLCIPHLLLLVSFRTKRSNTTTDTNGDAHAPTNQ